MSDIGELFNETFHRRVIDDWVIVWSFRRVARAGLPMARESVSTYAERVVQEFLGDPQKGLYTGDPERRTESMSIFARAMAAADIENTQAAVDAASVVFAHSILDGAAYDCCRISATVAPMDWEPEISERSVKIGAIKSSPHDKLVREAVEKYLDSLEREALPAKVDRLFAKSHPPQGWSPMAGYVYDPDRLRAFDQRRHDIIHGEGPKVIAGLDAELDYMSRTTFFFLLLLNHRYGLKIDPSYMLRRPPRS